MSGSKKLGYQGVCVLWMNFQVCNETGIQWHFKLKEEESRQPCMWLLSASAKETPPPWPAVSQRSTTASAKAMVPACSPTWISSSKTCVWQQQSSETAAARNGAIAPQRCHWTANRHSVTAICSELARANFCRKPKAVQQKLLQGSRAQQSCQAALVKALLTQGLSSAQQMHLNKGLQQKQENFSSRQRLVRINIFEPKSPLSNLTEVGWQGPALFSKAGWERGDTETGKHNCIISVFRRNQPGKKQTDKKKTIKPTTKNPTYKPEKPNPALPGYC